MGEVIFAERRIGEIVGRVVVFPFKTLSFFLTCLIAF